MPLDTSIARSVRPLKIQFRDLGADYNQLAQMQSADTQNQLAQMQMQESRQLAPLRLQEQQSRAATAKMELDEVNEAKTIVSGIMAKIAEFPDAPRDPFVAAKEMINSTNAKVRAGGEQFLKSLQILQEFKDDQRYATVKDGVARAPTAPAATPAAAAPPMAAAAPAAPQEMFVTKDSSGRPRYVMNGVEVSPQEYQSAQSGVVVGAAPAAKPIGYELPVSVNALAPAAAALATNVNAMAAPVAKTAADIKAEINSGDLQFGKSKKWAKERELLVDEFKEAIKPGRKADTAPDVMTMQALGYPLTQEGYSAFRAAQRTDRLLTPEEEAQRARIAVAGRAPPTPKDDPTTTAAFSQVDAAGNVTFYNKFGNPISTQKGAGKPSATFEKTTAQRKQLSNDLTTAINELTDITKDGGLIDQSTGSGAGRLVDLAAGFGGIATPGAIAIGKLQPVADLVLKMVPRFEGPQSNADTTSYKQAAAQLADPTLPAAIRKEAGKTVLRLMIKRKGQFVTQSMADEGMVPSGGAPAANVDALLDKYK